MDVDRIAVNAFGVTVGLLTNYCRAAGFPPTDRPLRPFRGRSLDDDRSSSPAAPVTVKGDLRMMRRPMRCSVVGGLLDDEIVVVASRRGFKSSSL